jgi:NADH-quinone oxidoreductase subunit J
MTIYTLSFYCLGVFILAATALAVTRSDPVHSVVYLILSFLGTAMLFYLFGAPFLAALEVIIYAGAIMVLFLFVLMVLKPEGVNDTRLSRQKWRPAFFLGMLYLVLTGLIIFFDPGSRVPLEPAMAAPKTLGRFVLSRYGLSVEIISLILLIGLLAVIQLGRGKEKEASKEGS